MYSPSPLQTVLFAPIRDTALSRRVCCTERYFRWNSIHPLLYYAVLPSVDVSAPWPDVSHATVGCIPAALSDSLPHAAAFSPTRAALFFFLVSPAASLCRALASRCSCRAAV